MYESYELSDLNSMGESLVRHKLEYRRISQMTYHPKIVGKMADFETLILCISLNSSQMCTNLRNDIVTGYCLVCT